MMATPMRTPPASAIAAQSGTQKVKSDEGVIIDVLAEGYRRLHLPVKGGRAMLDASAEKGIYANE